MSLLVPQPRATPDGKEVSGHVFAGTAAIATMHRKERVIGPILANGLHVHVAVAPDIDTDTLGTFTGETVRRGSAQDAAIAKARLALRHAPDSRYGIGSEGSFGPHPLMPFMTSGREIVALLSRDEDVLVTGYDLTTETNCAEVVVPTTNEALEAAFRFGFPTHGAVVTGVLDGRPFLRAGMTKGIVSIDAFRDAVARMLADCGAACVQSDMRAHLNPTRMRAIERATHDLVRRATARCPDCHHPGYDVVEHVPGLPCDDCGEPSDVALAVVYGCARCQQRVERPRSDGLTSVPAADCGFCNP